MECPVPQTRESVRQPIYWVLRDEGRSIAGVARRVPVTNQQLKGAVYGWTPPSPLLRARLPVLLGRPLEALFTQDALNTQYLGQFGPKRPRGPKPSENAQ